MRVIHCVRYTQVDNIFFKLTKLKNAFKSILLLSIYKNVKQVPLELFSFVYIVHGETKVTMCKQTGFRIQKK